jgi:hypothetical protein
MINVQGMVDMVINPKNKCKGRPIKVQNMLRVGLTNNSIR